MTAEDDAEIVERIAEVGVTGREVLLAQGQGFACDDFRAVHLAGVDVQLTEVQQALGEVERGVRTSPQSDGLAEKGRGAVVFAEEHVYPPQHIEHLRSHRRIL